MLTRLPYPQFIIFSNWLRPNLTTFSIDSLSYSVFTIFFLQSGEKLDKIELAFRKFDKNQDGFLSKEEFDVVSFTVDQGMAGT